MSELVTRWSRLPGWAQDAVQVVCLLGGCAAVALAVGTPVTLLVVYLVVVAVLLVVGLPGVRALSRRRRSRRRRRSSQPQGGPAASCRGRRPRG
ncbi:hypothetical protein [Rhodococcus aerolatus]